MYSVTISHLFQTPSVSSVPQETDPCHKGLARLSPAVAQAARARFREEARALALHDFRRDNSAVVAASAAGDPPVQPPLPPPEHGEVDVVAIDEDDDFFAKSAGAGGGAAVRFIMIDID